MNVGSGPGLGWPDVGSGGLRAEMTANRGLGWPAASGNAPPLPVDADTAAWRSAAPSRVRGALAGVSRETGGAADARARPVPAAGSELAAATGAAASAAVGLQARAAADNVGGAGDRSGESEVQVAIPSLPDTVADTPIARAAQAAVVARSGGVRWPRPSSCRIITVANQKGGVGKTTTAVNLAASLAMHGARVLVIDLDPQGNASTALDVDHHSGVPSVYNVLVDGMPLSSVVQQVGGYPQLYCAPAAIDLAGAEIELVPLVAREARLGRALAGYDATNLDYIFIDCPPSLGLLTVNALVAAPEVLIPIQCEYYALEGLEQLLRTVDLVRSHLNPALAVTTILLTMYDGRTRLASQVADEVREHFGGVVLGSVIPRSVRVSEAPSYGQSVMTYDPGSSGALAYLEASKELAYRNAAQNAG
jgi:chromosome partitioning protein